MVVLDDDPTGIQTVHGCLLVTDWSQENLRTAFSDEQHFFYILTNTRAMTREEAARVTRSAMEAVVEANREFGYRLIVVGRSDSCLRGHFPLETDVVCDVLREHGIAVWPRRTFCPAFIESGRVTIDGVHYMKDGERLIPTSETEFARDNVFHYSTSVLRDYIIEKGANPDDYDIVNAQSYDELYAYVDKLETETKDFDGAVVIRSSSSLPRALSHIPDKPLLSREALGIRDGGTGLFIVGSHVQKTTRQLNALLECEGTKGIELPIDHILDDGETLMAETLAVIADLVGEGVTPVVFTARKEVRIDDPDKRQRLGQTVSDFLVSIVRNIGTANNANHPSAAEGQGKDGSRISLAYLVAKGGITSHDILTHGLNVKVARVMGQAINSVPCIMAELCGQPLPYVIFPGNVGNDNSLREIYEKL